MEIFRHYYSGGENGEWATSVFFQKHMNDFGFCKMDGSPITMDWTAQSGDLTMRYKLDPKKQVYLYNDAYKYGSQPIPRGLCSCAANICCHLSNQVPSYQPHQLYHHMADNGANGEYAILYGDATVFFLPLKNKGFLLNIRGGKNVDHQSDGNNPSYKTGADPRDKGFLLATPTPSLNTKVYSTVTFNSSAFSPGVLTLIGLPPCKGNNNWTYLLYTRNAYLSNKYEYTLFTKALIDFGDGKVFDMPFKSNFIRKNNITSYNELTYTDINNNVCSLVKMPYDTGYIDGLYLMTTSPQQLEDCTFFSFDGRNFLNVFENYVLELPSSSS